MNMSSTNYQRFARIYGVDFGSHSISISKIEIDVSPIMPYDDPQNSSQISYLTDSIGKRTIYNGVQYVTPHENCDAPTFYKRRKLGNECVRSKPVYSIGPDTEDPITEQRSAISASLPDQEIEIEYEIAEVAIVTQIRELIDQDLSTANVSNLQDVRVIFALPSWHGARDIEELRRNIEVIFNMDQESKSYPMTLEFITSSHAMAFARFNQVFPNYVQQGSLAKREEHNTLILNSGHNSTEIMEVRTKYDSLHGSYHLDVLKKLRYPVGGAELNFRIGQLIKKPASSKEVEKVKHDLSMYQSTIYHGDDGKRNEVNRSDMNLTTSPFNRLIREIKQFIMDSDCDTIELAGGFSRSFIFRDLISDCQKEKDLRLLRGLSADEVTALGAATFGGIRAMKKTDVNFVRSMNKTVYFDGWHGSQGNKKIDQTVSRINQDRPYLLPNSVQSSYKETVELDADGNCGIVNENQNILINILDDSRLVEIHFDFDLLDRVRIIHISEMGYSSPLKYLSEERELNLQPISSEDIMEIERPFRKANDMYVRIGALYNKIEEFYFDREKYAQKKQAIREEIQRIENSYAYSTGELEDWKQAYRRLLDTYEFCRIVAVDPDLLNEENYSPDPEVVIDPRLNREVVDQLLRTEQGLKTMEQMIADY